MFTIYPREFGRVGNGAWEWSDVSGVLAPEVFQMGTSCRPSSEIVSCKACVGSGQV